MPGQVGFLKMTLQEMYDAFGYPPKAALVVETRSGAQYEVPYDVAEMCDHNDDWVYGFRVNSFDRVPGWIRKGRAQRNGTVRWFAIKNIKVAS